MLKETSLEFASLLIDCLYDLDAIGVTKDNAISRVESEIEDLLSLNEEKTIKKRFEYFCIPGTQPDDFKESFYELSPGTNIFQRAFRAGILGEAGRGNQSFISLIMAY